MGITESNLISERDGKIRENKMGAKLRAAPLLRNRASIGATTKKSGSPNASTVGERFDNPPNSPREGGGINKEMGPKVRFLKEAHGRRSKWKKCRSRNSPIQFASYRNMSITFKRRLASLHQYPLCGFIYLVIYNLRREGDDGDKRVGGVFFRHLVRKKDPCGRAITDAESFEPIGQKWMFDALSGHLKEPTGLVISRGRDQITNISTVVQKEIGGGGSEIRQFYGNGYYAKTMC